MNKDLSVASKQLLLFIRSEIPSVHHSASARSCSNKETGSWSLIQKYLWPIHFANPGLKILAFHLIKLRENVYVFYCRMLVGRKTSTGRMWQVVTAVVITCMLVSSVPHNASVPVWGKPPSVSRGSQAWECYCVVLSAFNLPLTTCSFNMTGTNPIKLASWDEAGRKMSRSQPLPLSLLHLG